VYIVGSIPPGPTRTLSQGWLDVYILKFAQILYPYRNMIQGLFFGHSHNDQFQILFEKGYAPVRTTDFEKEWTATIFITPSITPRDASDPSWRKYFFEFNTFEILDYLSFHLFLTAAQSNIQYSSSYSLDYSFYGVYSATPSNIPDLWTNFRGEYDHSGIAFYYDKLSGTVIYPARFSYQTQICAITQFLNDARQSCLSCGLCQYPANASNPASGIFIIPIIVVACIFIGVAGFIYYRRRRASLESGESPKRLFDP